MKKVDFISMDEGTREDYDLIAIHDSKMKEVYLKE